MNVKEPIIIQTYDLSKSYNGIEALKNLNLKVRTNSIFGFLGPNGAGKTTTIKLLLGLIQPTAGTATIFDQDIVRNSMSIRARVGYLPQEPHFYEFMTAREVLRFAICFYFSGPKEKIEARINEVLKLIGLVDKADRPIKGFSGGEKQRLGIGQSVIHFPDLLILDEPTAALDPLGRQSVLDLMVKLRETATIFYSTHILDDVQKVSDTVGILNRGDLVAKGDIETLLAGTEGTIYLIKLKGDSSKIYNNIESLPYISEIQETKKNNITQWSVKVSNDEEAETSLLREILKDDQIKVIDYRLKQYELEEIFQQVVESK